MAKIDSPDDLFKHFNFSKDCKLIVSQLYNTHKERFLKALAGICGGIKRQAKEILENEYEYPKGTFYVKTYTLKIVYKKQTLETIGVNWQDS
ncbi:hypothetical protein [uncultured Helicobacter sp.]|uniref:hypothetical protein n=2 Tax=uncultured Helicobacter sp. TaxID=175537 RepID=UPI0025DA693E|nr:hypothetical protein [uncultured Helicobacter sp.]